MKFGALAGIRDVEIGEILVPKPNNCDTDLYRKSDGSFAGSLLAASDCVTVNTMCESGNVPEMKVCYVSRLTAAFDVEVLH